MDGWKDGWIMFVSESWLETEKGVREGGFGREYTGREIGEVGVKVKEWKWREVSRDTEQ